MKTQNTKKTTKQEIENWIALDPDQILLGKTDMKRWNFDSDTLYEMAADGNVITIMKQTLLGNTGIQLFLENNTVKIDTL